MFWVISCTIIGMISFDMFALLYPPIYVLSNIALSIGTIWLIVIMLKESKVLFILPFELCKLTVLDSRGQGIYEYAWKITKDDVIISPMLGKLVTELNSRMDNAGTGILDINGTCITLMKEGSITGILLATKSSLFLKNMLASFLSSFNEVFKDVLSRGRQDSHAFRAADSLVEKVFSTIPSRILIKDDQPVRLKIDGSRDPRLHGDLRKTLEEAENMEMEMEIISSPDDVIEEVNELYDELHDELNDEIQE
ncbi:hypothetical protein GF325_12830 [Candidatus Bathyarchaeota archaeon]|nr:hypothetical protein [Candidatus Bathyarchaeota archaeon]